MGELLLRKNSGEMLVESRVWGMDLGWETERARLFRIYLSLWASEHVVSHISLGMIYILSFYIYVRMCIRYIYILYLLPSLGIAHTWLTNPTSWNLHQAGIQ